jgi:hypothetical protein
MVIRDLGVNVRGTIFYKSVQILAYADDIDLIGRMQKAVPIWKRQQRKCICISIKEKCSVCQLPKKSAQLVLLI